MFNLTLKHKKTVFIFILGMALNPSYAQYKIKKYSINSGGSTLNGGQYELTSSIGQTDASRTLTGDDFSLNGGYWHENTDLIYKNGLE